MRRDVLIAVVLVGAGLLAIAGAFLVGRDPEHAAPPAPSRRSTTPAKATDRPHRAIRSIWGPARLPNGRSAMATYRDLGVEVLQVQVPWSTVASRRPAHPTDPNDPAYRWPSGFDAEIREATAAGIRIAVMIKSTPDWANGGRGVARAPDRDADYTDFLRAAAARYPAVHLWMVWGETTRSANFQPMPADSDVGPKRYAKLLDAAYAALKADDPDNVVIGGMTWTVGEVKTPDFIKWLRLPTGRPPRMDLWGHNPYATRSPDIRRDVYSPGVRDISDVDTVHRELQQAYGKRRAPDLWLSEFSVSSDRDNRGFAFHVSQAEQATWLSEAFDLADSQHYVTALGWYELLDDPPTEEGGLTEGLLTADGRRKPAYAAYRAAAR